MSVSDTHPRFDTVICRVCGEPYRVRWAERSTRKYCSHACNGVARRKYGPAVPNPDRHELRRLTERIEAWQRVNAELRGLVAQTEQGVGDAI